jgi:hypothetical protein
MSNQEKHFYEFGPFRLDPVKRRLLRDGEPVALSPKVFDTLYRILGGRSRSRERVAQAGFRFQRSADRSARRGRVSGIDLLPRMSADGSDRKQLTADAGVNLHQAVTPDGRYIVFTSNRAGVLNIWRMNSDGSDLLRLTDRGGEKYPHCSPDGNWVIYNSVDPDESLYSL